jgi:hypothetical protein
MFAVYTRHGEFELSTADEVRRLFGHHQFSGSGDYFTVGRDGVDYLEIYSANQGFLLAYIGPDENESSPVAEHASCEEVDAVLATFCSGAADFLGAIRAAAGPAENAAAQTPARGAPPAPTRDFAARPIEPESCHAAPAVGALLVLSLLAIGAAAAWIAQAYVGK